MSFLQTDSGGSSSAGAQPWIAYPFAMDDAVLRVPLLSVGAASAAQSRGRAAELLNAIRACAPFSRPVFRDRVAIALYVVASEGVPATWPPAEPLRQRVDIALLRFEPPIPFAIVLIDGQGNFGGDEVSASDRTTIFWTGPHAGAAPGNRWWDEPLTQMIEHMGLGAPRQWHTDDPNSDCRAANPATSFCTNCADRIAEALLSVRR